MKLSREEIKAIEWLLSTVPESQPKPERKLSIRQYKKRVKEILRELPE